MHAHTVSHTDCSAFKSCQGKDLASCRVHQMIGRDCDQKIQNTGWQRLGREAVSIRRKMISMVNCDVKL